MKGAYEREAAANGLSISSLCSSQFLSISCESGMTLDYVCSLVSMPLEWVNILSSCALQPTVHIVSIASASPFLLMSMTLAPPYSWSNISDALSPHFSLIRFGMSSRRIRISVPCNDLIRARGRNENCVPAEDGHHQTITCMSAGDFSLVYLCTPQ